MILDFVKSFLTLFLLIKVLLYFVPKNVFQKYIAFFSGVILVIGLLYPILQGSGTEEELLEKSQYERWEEELYAIAQNAAKLEESGREVLKDYYSEVTENAGIEDIAIETIKIENVIQAGVRNE